MKLPTERCCAARVSCRDRAVACAGRSLAAALPWLVAAAAWLSGCGVAMRDVRSAQDRAHERLEREAVRWSGASARLPAGAEAVVTMELRVAEGFYVPAPGAQGPGIDGLRLGPPRLAWLAADVVDIDPEATWVRLPGATEVWPMLSGVHVVRLRLRVAAGTAPGPHTVRLAASWQRCTVRGCSVPQQEAVVLAMEVLQAAAGDDRDLAP